jgi:hypothetical protein
MRNDRPEDRVGDGGRVDRGSRQHASRWLYVFGAVCFILAFRLAWSAVDIKERLSISGRPASSVTLALEGVPFRSPAAVDVIMTVELGRVLPLRGCPDTVTVRVRFQPRGRDTVAVRPTGRIRVSVGGREVTGGALGSTFRRPKRHGGIDVGGELSATLPSWDGDWRKALGRFELDFEARWVEQRGLGSCWVLLPALVPGGQGTRWGPKVSFGEVVLSAESISTDDSQPPPALAHNIWQCRPYAPAHRAGELCAAWVVVDAPWRPLFINLALIFAGVLLSLGVELWVRAFLRG